MNNIENNRMLAEFIGYNFEIVNDEVYFTHDDMLEAIAEEDLNFQTDWNLLMELIAKIEDLGNDVLITTNYIQIAFDEGEQFVVVEDIKNKIEAVYNACIEFVKWYNEQNPRA
jgi:hypothetical protein